MHSFFIKLNQWIKCFIKKFIKLNLTALAGFGITTSVYTKFNLFLGAFYE